MKDWVLIGIDAGTSVIKSIAFTVTGEQIAAAAIPNRYQTFADGGAEQDMARTWADTAATLKELADSGWAAALAAGADPLDVLGQVLDRVAAPAGALLTLYYGEGVTEADATATAAALGVLTPMPCVPVFPAPWAPGTPTVMLGNLPVLNNTSTLNCAYGGVITISMPGQMTEMTP